MDTEKIWYKDPVNFISDPNKLLSFIPKQNSTITEQLNDAFRFSIYFGVIVTIMRQDLRALFFILFTACLTYFIYSYEENQRVSRAELFNTLNMKQDKQGVPCTLPSKSNPFMNVLLSDYEKFPNRPSACKITNKPVKDKINTFLTETIPRDVEDVFSKSPIDLQFHTVPSTTIPNNQGDFAKWLYGKGQSFKEKGVLSYDWR
jgi:hypothetical protein